MTTRAVAEPHRLRDASVFGTGLPLTSFGRDRARIEQEARGKLGPFNLLATVTASGQQGAKPDTRLVAHEAYADFSLGGERFSLGRKVLSGDVGYAFRPLDVLQRESRLQLAPPPLTGIPMIAWDNFCAEIPCWLIVPNRGHGPGTGTRHGGRVGRHARVVDETGDGQGTDRHGGSSGSPAGPAGRPRHGPILPARSGHPWQHRAVSDEPADTESAYELLQRGQALMRRRHNAQAAVVLERAARLEPGKGSILEALGRSCFPLVQFWRFVL